LPLRRVFSVFFAPGNLHKKVSFTGKKRVSWALVFSSAGTLYTSGSFPYKDKVSSVFSATGTLNKKGSFAREKKRLLGLQKFLQQESVTKRTLLKKEQRVLWSFLQ